MKKNKKIISITLDRAINNIMEEKKINKSKLINFLIDNFIKNEEDMLKNFLRKK